MALCHLLGLEISVTDEEIMERLREARENRWEEVTFTASGRKVIVRLPA